MNTLQTQTQLALPGAAMTPVRQRKNRDGSITLIFPPGAAVATIAGKWYRRPDGTIEANFTPEELELCTRAIDE